MNGTKNVQRLSFLDQIAAYRKLINTLYSEDDPVYKQFELN